MPSEAYQRALAEATAHHASSKTYSGKLLRPHKNALLQVVATHGIRSAIDYGCGKGAQYEWREAEDGNRTIEEALGFEVAKYDPAWPPFAAKPAGPFDLGICTHVLGSIPVQDLHWVLCELCDFSQKAIYIAEKIGAVGKTALSAPEERPVGWNPEQWLVMIRRQLADGGYDGAIYFSAREKTDAGTRTRRWVSHTLGPWMPIYDSAVQP